MAYLKIWILSKNVLSSDGTFYRSGYCENFYCPRHTGALIHGAEIGKLSLVTKHGHPVFLAVPFSEDLLELGLRPAIAIKLYTEGTVILGKAAKLAGQSIEGFMDKLAHLGIPVLNYNADEVLQEIKDFD
jgi:predicted HTH domain antitoxin